MLNDHERKLLRILHNYIVGRKRVPSIEELVIKTGRAPWVVQKTLQALTDKQFILWEADRHYELKVIRAWEEQPAREPAKKWWEYE